MIKSLGAKSFGTQYLALAMAGWLGEETCIAIYQHYHYASDWTIWVDRVPLAIALTWPFVILYAIAVVRAVLPKSTGVQFAGLVGLLVCFDASVVEIIATLAGFWVWAEPGHLGVPLIGTFGWGAFAFAAVWAMQRCKNPVALILLPPLVTHGLLVAAWWGFYRWLLRGDVTTTSIWFFIGAGVLCLGIALTARKHTHLIPLSVALPRIVAAALFVTCLVLLPTATTWHWIHFASLAIPYIAASRLNSQSIQQ